MRFIFAHNFFESIETLEIYFPTTSCEFNLVVEPWFEGLRANKLDFVYQFWSRTISCVYGLKSKNIYSEIKN